MENTGEELTVYTYTLFDKKNKHQYTHWSKDLVMIIRKNGVKLKLKGEEIEKIIKSLPPTIGGTY